MKDLERNKHDQINLGSNKLVDGQNACTLKSTAGLTQRIVHRNNGQESPYRITLYSHDTMGLGHMRRNLLIAEALTGSHFKPLVLVIAGAREVGCFPIPPRTDCLALPALYKEVNGQYKAHHLDMSLEELIGLRSRIILAVVKAFQPDLLIVDKAPRGVLGELEATLEYLRKFKDTRCVFGMRDILDDTVAIRQEWCLSSYEEAILNWYDRIWVYGDPNVYDVVHEYQLRSDIAALVRYTGYLGYSSDLKKSQLCGIDEIKSLGLSSRRFVLCLVGGGQDGTCLAEAFAEADFPPETTGVIVTGPHMPIEAQKHLHRLAVNNSHLRVVTFNSHIASLIQRAERVVAMGGYNTICEVLYSGKPVLIVPRVSPRREQLIRAERLRDLGLLKLLHPDELTPQALSKWLSQNAPYSQKAKTKIDFRGFQRLPSLVEELMIVDPSIVSSHHNERRAKNATH